MITSYQLQSIYVFFIHCLCSQRSGQRPMFPPIESPPQRTLSILCAEYPMIYPSFSPLLRARKKERERGLIGQSESFFMSHHVVRFWLFFYVQNIQYETQKCRKKWRDRLTCLLVQYIRYNLKNQLLFRNLGSFLGIRSLHFLLFSKAYFKQ